MNTKLNFIKSSFCPGSGWGPLCVEVAKDGDNIVVKDSKNPSQEPLSFTKDEWSAFVKGVKNNEFDF